MDKANKAHPGVWWWVKGDGTDIIPGLGESVKQIWSGDVDLADGKLQALYDEYLQQQCFIEGLGLGGRQGRWDVSNDTLELESQLKFDIDFLVSGMIMLLSVLHS